jgi:hypothetical protein
MTLEIYTLVHVAISPVGIASGFVALFGLLVGKTTGGVGAFHPDRHCRSDQVSTRIDPRDVSDLLALCQSHRLVFPK